MTCRHVRQLHDAFLDGELSASLTAEVHAHLLQCPACQHQIEMLRACADVVARDRPAAALSEDFAERVVAAIPRTSAGVPAVRQVGVRQRRWTVWLGAGLPAAAAVVLLVVLLWPDTRQDRTFVAGVAVSGLDHVVNPALDAVAESQRAAASLNQLWQLSVGDAERGVRAKLKDAGDAKGPTPGVSFTDVLFLPFDDELTRALSPADEASSRHIIRF